MHVSINGSPSHMSDNVNHLLSKVKMTRHMVKLYDINYLLDVVNKNVNIPSEYSLKVIAFVITIVFDRDYAMFYPLVTLTPFYTLFVMNNCLYLCISWCLLLSHVF